LPNGVQPAFDVVVVGSGFGGAITAQRVAEAGKSVVVLERGRRYVPGGFPRDTRDVDRLLWRNPRVRQARGLYDIRFFRGLGAIVASGVGGGSLVYANIHIRPDAVVFDDPRWPRGYDRAALDPYYDKVAAGLQVAPVPASVGLVKRDRYRQAAQQLGRPVFDPDEAVAWTQPPGPGRRACQLCAECEFGCQHGAKHTLDLTYLARAEALGAQVWADRLVTRVVPNLPAGHRVEMENLETGQKSAVIGRRVVLAAGTLGTNELLLRGRAEGWLPNLSARLGQGYSANGDFLGNVQGMSESIEPWRGPDVTSVMRFDDFTLAAPTFSRPVMEALVALGQPPLRRFRALTRPFWRALGWLLPWVFRRGLLARPAPAGTTERAARMTNLFAIGRDNANGRLRLRRGRLELDWDFAGENAALIERMSEAMQQVAAAYGGRLAFVPTWDLFGRILTVHSLGGCRLGETPEQGVVAPNGEVHGHPDLFVADGSVIPTAIGFHPAMTISAVAERIAAHVAGL
jgi:cholesterol oxidase